MSKTKDRILDTALNLFNEQGTAPVSTNHIAEAAGISPGNLYYHFSNKEEIIRALFEQLFHLWDVKLVLPPDKMPTLDDVRELIKTSFSIMWEYRFVYRETLALLRQDEILHERYITVRKRGYEGFYELASVIARNTDAVTLRRMADICWLISEFWLPTLEMRGQRVGQENLQEGIDLMMEVLTPYIGKS